MVSAVLPKTQDGTPTHSDTEPERHNPPGGRASGEPWPNSKSVSNLASAIYHQHHIDKCSNQSEPPEAS